MPLFGRRLFPTPKDIPSENDRDEIFRIEHTGEEFHSEEVFRKLQQVYALERWTCECTWRASLTHADAMKSEIETRATLPSLVPDYFHQPIFEVIHHNVKPLEKLAEEVSIVLSQSFVLGEPVQFRKKREAISIKGTIERVEENDESRKRASVQAKLPSDKQMKNVKYTVRLTDADRTIDHVSPSELQRCQLIPNREKLKVFIRAHAIRLGNRADSPWIFYDNSTPEKYQIKDRFPMATVERFKKSMTVTLEEILREQERIVRKKSEASQEKLPISTDQLDEIQIILSDDEDLSRLFTSPTKKKKKRAMKTPLAVEKPLVPLYEIVVPCALLQKLEKVRRDRGIDSKFFHRVVLQCARTLDEKQRQRLPDEYRSFVQMKFEDLELKRRLGQMTDEEKKLFFQSKREEQKPVEDLDLPLSKALPSPNAIASSFSLSTDSIGHFLMIGAFLTSSHSLFSLSLTDDLPKVTQQYLRSFRVDSLLNGSSTMFFKYFLDVFQLLMKLLFKEDENRSKNDEEQQNDTNNNYEHMDLDRDLEQIYATKLTDIPLTPSTCQELTRLYLLKEKDEHHRPILDKLSRCETKDLSIDDQIDLLHLLINTITSDNELMSEYFEHLNRILAEASRERRRVQEEETKQKKLQLQNGEHDKVRPLITPKNSNNDENRQASSPVVNDENGEIDDDLKTVLQRRRQMVAMTKELKEKRELEVQKQHLLQKRQLVLQKAEQTYQEALLNVQYGFRIKPLGFDRHFNRYWFFRGHPGLFVEKGWIGPDINYSIAASPTESSSIPKDEPNRWFVYDNEPIIQQVMQSLNDRGIREHHLLVNLKKSMPLIHQEFEQTKKWKASLEAEEETTADLSEDVIISFRSELEEIETRLRLGSLGGFVTSDQLQRWQDDLQRANERLDLGELLVQLQQTVPDKYASGIFSLHEKKFLQIWTKDCRTCQTYSRLYVLMMIFENAISWNKSTVGMKCKVCRKKHTDESILVCDQCCHGFHSECLRVSFRPACNSTSDLWYCPACQPRATTKRREKKAASPEEYDMQVDSPSSASDDLSVSHTDDEDANLCCVCEMDNDIFQCTQCQQFYHCQCHQPPLRCPPRSNTWLCNNCRNGITGSRTKRVKANGSRKNSRKHPSSEREEKSQRRSKRIRRQTGSSSSSEGEETDMELDNHESPSSD